ncbi:MAG: hypothetical protein HYR94_08840, partial [Chloroflexi bacterium]|nr:hypothetical protein [Chloroflexota bacterium]
MLISLVWIIVGWMQQPAMFAYAQTNLQLIPPTQEVWPPFWFDLTPSYENGKIVYTVALSRRVDWLMPNLTVKIPLPEGTRFVEAKSPPDVQTQFDGREITFLAPAFNRYFEGNFFIVEITDPAKTIFTSQARISWGGERQGTYESETISFDITRKPLNWTAPPASSLQLGVGAVVANNTIRYILYPKAIGLERMWDMKINLPLPEGSTFLSVNAPPAFATHFDGRENSFKALELERQSEPTPLTFSVSTKGITTPVVATHVWADWKNALLSNEPGIPAEEQIMIDLVVRQPDTTQQVVFDQAGDVPFANYDLTSIAFQDRGPILAIIFNTAAPIGPVKQPLEYTLFIDSDCNNS